MSFHPGGAVGYICLLRFVSSRSLRLALILSTAVTPAMATTTAASAITISTTDSTVIPLWLLALLWSMCSLLATVIFHWVMVPLQDWIVERLS